LSLKNLRILSFVFLLFSCVERINVENPSVIRISEGKGVWVLTTLSPEVWYIKDSSQRVMFASLWANDILKVGDTLFIVNSGTNDIYRYILSDGRMDTLRVGAGRNPYNIGYSSITNEVFVSNLLTSTISVFKGTQLIEEIPTCGNPQGIMTLGKKLFVACTNYTSDYHGVVYIYDILTRRLMDSIRVGTNTQSVISDPEGDVYILSTGNYSGIETSIFRVRNSEIDSFYVGGYLGNMCLSERGFLFIVGWYGGVYKFNWVEEKGEGFIKTDISASSCAVKGDTLVVSDFDNDRILYLNFNGSVLKEFYVGDGPIDVEAE